MKTKNKPANALKIASLGVGCMFALGACLSCVLPVKKTSAEGVSLPPTGLSYTESQSYVPSFYGYSLDFCVQPYTSSTSVESYHYYDSYGLCFEGEPLLVENNLLLDDIPVYVSRNTSSTIYTRFDLRDGRADTPDNFFSVRAVYNNGAMYLDETLYEHLFGGFTINIGGATDYQFLSAYIRGSLLLSVGRVDNGVLVYDELTYDVSVSSNARFLSFYPDNFQTLEELGYVNNGYLIINRCSMYVYIGAPNFNGGYVSFTLNHLSPPLPVSTLAESQLYGRQEYEPVFGRPVDTLGIDSLFNSVSGFLNIELFPEFKIWYFFLIAVGLSILGLGLKFFFGG